MGSGGSRTLRISSVQGDVPPPLLLPEPVIVKVELAYSGMGDKAGLLPGARRLDGRTIEFQALDMITAYRGFRAIVSLARTE